MFKKIIIALIFIFCLFFLSQNFVSASCDENGWIDSCLQWSLLVDPGSDLKIEWWFKSKIIEWTRNIAWFLWLIAVWAMVYAWLTMTLSVWEDEKIKKSKDMIKWSLLWFLWIILASSLITIVVEFMYSVWE